MNKSKANKQWIFIVCSMGFLGGLAAFSYMGLNMRLIGDDYCYAAVLTKYGFFNGQLMAFINPMPFHGNRYTLTFLSLLFSLFHPKINGYIPLMMIFIFCMGIFLLQTTFSRYFNKKISTSFKIFISVAIVFFTFLLTPTINQSLYWRSSMIPSTKPIIVTLYLLILILRKSKGNWLELVFIFLFSFIIGGLSENGVLLQLSAISILLLVLWVLIVKKRISSTSIKKTFTAILGTVSSAFIMWISPSIAQEQSEMTISLIETLRLSLSYTIGFYSGFVKSFYVAIISLILIGFLSYLLNYNNPSVEDKIFTFKWNDWIIYVLFSQIVVLFIIFSNMIPSAFTRNAYPDPRHLIIGTFASVVGFIVVGCFLGKLGNYLLSRYGARFYAPVTVGIILLLISITVFYPIRYIPHVTENQRIFRYWSYQWDRRDIEIKRKIASEEKILHVMRLDSIIEGVGEISPDPNYWYNLCAADYYGTLRIYANLPGWEEEWSDIN